MEGTMAGKTPAYSGFRVWRESDAVHACADSAKADPPGRTLCGRATAPGAIPAHAGELRITCENCLEKLAAAW